MGELFILDHFDHWRDKPEEEPIIPLRYLVYPTLEALKFIVGIADFKAREPEPDPIIETFDLPIFHDSDKDNGLPMRFKGPTKWIAHVAETIEAKYDEQTADDFKIYALVSIATDANLSVHADKLNPTVKAGKKVMVGDQPISLPRYHAKSYRFHRIASGISLIASTLDDKKRRENLKSFFEDSWQSGLLDELGCQDCGADCSLGRDVHLSYKNSVNFVYKLALMSPMDNQELLDIARSFIVVANR